MAMKLDELLPELTGLSRSDKEQAMSFLASELAKDQTTQSKVGSGDLDEAVATESALAFYRSNLQSMLEPEHNGESVAIHIDSGTYEVAKRPGHAYRAVRSKNRTGTIVVHHIGVANSGLRARMRGERYN